MKSEKKKFPETPGEEIDKFYKEGLTDYSVKPPSHLWENFRKDISKKQSDRNLFYRYKYLFLMATALILVIALIMWKQQASAPLQVRDENVINKFSDSVSVPLKVKIERKSKNFQKEVKKEEPKKNPEKERINHPRESFDSIQKIITNSDSNSIRSPKKELPEASEIKNEKKSENQDFYKKYLNKNKDSIRDIFVK